LIKNAAIERWYFMRTNVHTNFRWTRRTIITGIIGCIIIPVGTYALCWTDDSKWNLTGIRKGQTKEDMKIKH
ncbi:5109_t:CDS:2, partial [Funneliformis geosporum]